MPIYHSCLNTAYFRPRPALQVKKNGQDRPIFKPRRVASIWRENIAAGVRPRSEKRWRATRRQPLLGTLLQILMLLDQVKSVVSLPEAPGRSAPPLFAPPPEGGNDAGKASALDSLLKPTLHQAAAAGHADRAGEQHLASELSKLEQTLLAGTGFRFSEKSARHVRQAPAPPPHISHARHRHAIGSIPSSATTARQVDEGVEEPSVGSSGGAGASPAFPFAERSIPTDSTDAEPPLEQFLSNSLNTLDLTPFVSDYLNTAGYPNTWKHAPCVPVPEIVRALYKELKPAPVFAGDPAAVDRLDPQALQPLMRYLMRECGFYGGDDGETVSPVFERQMLKKLFSQWAGRCHPPSLLQIAGYSLEDDMRYQHPIKQIKAKVENQVSFLMRELPQDAVAWVTGIILADAHPTLARADTPDDLGYGSLAWADLQGGIDTVTALGLDHWSMSYDELLGLSRTNDMAMRLEPDASAELLRPQTKAALIFAIAQGTLSPAQPGANAAQSVEQALASLVTARTARWVKLQQAVETIQEPIPTRRRIAKQILREHRLNPGMSIEDPHARQNNGAIGVGGPSRTTLLDAYLSGSRSLLDRELPNPDAAFHQNYTQYRMNAESALQAFFDAEIQNLPAEDRAFWQKGTAQIGTLSVKLRFTPPGIRSGANGLTYHTEPQLAIAMVYNADGRQTRRYIVSLPHSANGTGPVFRTFEIDSAHPEQSWLRIGEHLYSAEQRKYIDSARQREWDVSLSNGQPGPALSVLTQHFTDLIEEQRDAAYEATGHQQFKQKTKDFLLSLVPFYDCVSEIKAGHAGAAAFSCQVDILSLIPVIGAMVKVGAAAGKLTISISASVLKQLAQAPLKGPLSRRILRTTAAEIVRRIPQIQSQIISGGKTLIRQTAELLDPGFDLAGLVVKGGINGIDKLVKAVREISQPFAERIGISLKRQPFDFDGQTGVWQMHPDAIIHRDGQPFAKIGEREIEVIDSGENKYIPVARFDTNDGAPFALVDPRNGLPYGPKWVQAAGGFEALGDSHVRLKGRAPKPDERGIIHFKQRDYIQLSDQHYPAAYDPYGRAWYIYRENDLNGYPVQVRYDANRSKWSVHGEVCPGSHRGKRMIRAGVCSSGSNEVVTTTETFAQDREHSFAIIHHTDATTREGSVWRDEVHHALLPEQWQSDSHFYLDNRPYRSSYESSFFNELTENQQRAVREWTFADMDDEIYARGPQPQDGINYELNEALRTNALLTSEEAQAYAGLSSALRKLPPVRDAQLMRIADVESHYLDRIRVGDTVTNAPCFMSASSKGTYASTVVGDQEAAGQSIAQEADSMLATYMITGQSAKPFLYDLSMRVDGEDEWLYLPDTLFRIRSISIARPAVIDEKRRVVILMQEIPYISSQPAIPVKNLHTGQNVLVRRPEGAPLPYVPELPPVRPQQEAPPPVQQAEDLMLE